LPDYLGGFAVSIHRADELAKEFKRQHDDYSATNGESAEP
jgi:cobalamin-dependent methionine synthase I